MLLIDEEAALVAMLEIARREQAEMSDVVRALRLVAEAAGPLAGDRAIRFARIEELFGGAADGASGSGPLAVAPRLPSRSWQHGRGDTKDKADAAE